MICNADLLVLLHGTSGNRLGTGKKIAKCLSSDKWRLLIKLICGHYCTCFDSIETVTHKYLSVSWSNYTCWDYKQHYKILTLFSIPPESPKVKAEKDGDRSNDGSSFSLYLIHQHRASCQCSLFRQLELPCLKYAKPIEIVTCLKWCTIPHNESELKCTSNKQRHKELSF